MTSTISMTTTIRQMALPLAVASIFFCAQFADAHSPVALTDGQLDGITASQGGPSAEVAAGATASGLTTLGNTGTVAVTGVGNSPFNGSGAYASGVAVGMGSNGVTPGTSNTNVTTFTEAPGNLVVNFGYNTTIYGVGGITFQVGVSASTGDLVPGLP